MENRSVMAFAYQARLASWQECDGDGPWQQPERYREDCGQSHRRRGYPGMDPEWYPSGIQV